MLQIPLQAIPNQTLSIQLNNNVIDLVIRTVLEGDAQITAMDVTIDNTLIVQGQRCVPGYPVIPYVYLFNGNFIWVTENDELPDFNKFGIDQSLIYVSQSEIEALLNAGT